MSDYDDDFDDYSEEFESYTEEVDTPVNPSVSEYEKPKKVESNVAPEDGYRNRYALSETYTNTEMLAKHKRAREILQEVTLSQEAFPDIFQMNPVKPIDVFKRDLGLSKIRNQGSQYNEDSVSVEVQTEQVVQVNKGVQFPNEIGTSTTEDGDMKNENNDEFGNVPINSVRLPKFLASAARVIEVLLVQNTELEQRHKLDENTVNHSQIDDLAKIAQTSLVLSLPDSLDNNRHVTCVHLSPAAPHTLLVAYSRVISTEKHTFSYGKETKSVVNLAKTLEDDIDMSKVIKDKSLICVWDVLTPNYPSKVLYCDGEISCVSMTLNKSDIVFAGLDAGSICLWDLKEENVLHRRINKNIADSNAGTFILRSASFSSDCFFSENHSSRVLKIIPLQEMKKPRNTDGKDNNSSFDMTSLAMKNKSSFQIASLESSGSVFIWTVIESRDASLAGNGMEFGLTPGSRIKLMQNTRINNKTTTTPIINLWKNSVSYDFMFNPIDYNEFFIAQSEGDIIRKKRFGESASPTTYVGSNTSSNNNNKKGGLLDNADGCTSVCFHSTNTGMFIAGYESGIIRLFDIEASECMHEWLAMDSGIVKVAWLPHLQNCFLALSRTGQFMFFDTARVLNNSPIEKKLPTFPIETSSLVHEFSLSRTKYETFLAIPSPGGKDDDNTPLSNVHVHSIRN